MKQNENIFAWIFNNKMAKLSKFKHIFTSLAEKSRKKKKKKKWGGSIFI